MNEITWSETDLYSGRKKTRTVRVGDRVRVRTWSGETVVGTVDGVHDPIKNDRPGIDYTTTAGAEHWAYLDQLV